MGRRRVARGVGRTDDGAVTAEIALGLPLLLALTAGLVWLLSIGAAQVQVIDASREAARALARGDDQSSAVSVARRIAPDGARVRVRRQGETLTVITSARVRGPGGLFEALPGVTLTSEAVALTEER